MAQRVRGRDLRFPVRGEEDRVAWSPLLHAFANVLDLHREARMTQPLRKRPVFTNRPHRQHSAELQGRYEWRTTRCRRRARRSPA